MFKQTNKKEKEIVNTQTTVTSKDEAAKESKELPVPVEKGDTTKHKVFFQEKQETSKDHYVFANVDESKESQQVLLLHIQKESEDDLKNVLLLDNQSTTDLFCNKKLMSNIRKVNGQCTVVTNGGNLYQCTRHAAQLWRCVVPP
jgi:hypothetical protein